MHKPLVLPYCQVCALSKYVDDAPDVYACAISGSNVLRRLPHSHLAQVLSLRALAASTNSNRAMSISGRSGHVAKVATSRACVQLADAQPPLPL